jgi:hypothetical protein
VEIIHLSWLALRGVGELYQTPAGRNLILGLKIPRELNNTHNRSDLFDERNSLIRFVLCRLCATYDKVKLLTLLFLFSGVYGSAHERVIGAHVTEVGIYDARVIKRLPTAGVSSGTNEWLDSISLIQATTNVPARLGTRFGFRYTIQGSPSNAPIKLTMISEHPPYKNPETGKTQTRDVYELDSWIGSTFTSYSFDYAWELVSGEFKFQVWHKGKKLCEQSFMVVADTKTKKKDHVPQSH